LSKRLVREVKVREIKKWVVDNCYISGYLSLSKCSTCFGVFIKLSLGAGIKTEEKCGTLPVKKGN
jgi:hypothetical protein